MSGREGQGKTEQPWGYALLWLALAVVLVFWPLSRHDFLNYDDQINVYENELVAKPTPANFGVFWTKPYKSLYIPLTYNGWQLQSKLSALFDPAGPNPQIFHLTNLLCHLLNTFLVFAIVRLLLANGWAAAAGALLFAVHPVQVEPVAWVTGFKDLFSGFWSLLAIWQYLLFQRRAPGDAGRRRHYGLTLLFLLAALLAKPSAVTIPAVIFLLAFWDGPRNLRQVALETAPFFLLALPFVVVTKLSQPDTVAMILPSLGERLLICGDTFWFYLGKILLPITIGPDYGRTPQFVLAQKWHFLTGLVPYALFILLLWKGSRRLQLAAGVFVVSILPVSGLLFFIFQISSTVADRYLYLALLGVALAVGLAVSRWQRRELRVAILAALLLLALRSSGRLPEAYRHFAEAARIFPRFEMAYNNMGGIQELSGRMAEAAELYLQTIRINPDFLIAYDNYGRMLVRRGNLAAGIRAFDEALATNPQAAIAHQHFATALLNGNQAAEASRQLEESIRLGNRSETVHSLLADAFAGLGRREEAASHYRQALQMNPNFAEAYNGLALLQMQQGDFESAVNNFRQALQVQPTMLQARGNLAVAYSLLGRPQEAGQQFAAILQVDGNSVEAHNGLGMVLLEEDRAAEAIPHFQAALRVQPDLPEVRKNLEMALGKVKGR